MSTTKKEVWNIDVLQTHRLRIDFGQLVTPEEAENYYADGFYEDIIDTEHLETIEILKVY